MSNAIDMNVNHQLAQAIQKSKLGHQPPKIYDPFIQTVNKFGQKLANGNVSLGGGENVVNPHTSFLYQITPISNVNTNAYTTNSSYEFEIPRMENYFSEDNMCLYHVIPVIESGGLAAVVPSFVENFFDEHIAIQYFLDGKLIYTVPRQQLLFNLPMVSIPFKAVPNSVIDR